MNPTTDPHRPEAPQPLSVSAWLAQAPDGHATAAQAVADGQAGDCQQPADGVEHFFAFEALARAHRAAADAAGAAAAAQQMAGLLPDIPLADGLRAWCEQALRELPDG